MHLVLTETAARVPDCYAREMGKTPLCPTRTPRSWRTSSSAADQAAIDEALFADMPEGSLLSEGPAARRLDAGAGEGPGHRWRPPRDCQPTARAPAASSCPWKCDCEGEASGRPRGGWDALGENCRPHYRMTSLL